MASTSKFDLYFLRTGRYFPAGTLVELGKDLVLPDDGLGKPVKLGSDDVLPCPPFAENVPPGQCPVTITALPVAGTAVVDQTLHYQVIEVPLADDVNQIVSVTVTDRLHGWQADRYETTSVEDKYRLHISHLPPGFYEAIVGLADRDSIRLTFIKFFPKHFTDRFPELVAEQTRRSTGSDIPAVPVPAVPRAPHRSGEPFSDELLNVALELVTEWGENFGSPIDERITRIYPGLSTGEIAEITKVSRAAESFIYGLGELELAGEITEQEIVPMAKERYPWLRASNAARLKNIAMFYARK